MSRYRLICTRNGGEAGARPEFNTLKEALHYADDLLRRFMPTEGYPERIETLSGKVILDKYHIASALGRKLRHIVREEYLWE